MKRNNSFEILIHVHARIYSPTQVFPPLEGLGCQSPGAAITSLLELSSQLNLFGLSYNSLTVT